MAKLARTSDENFKTKCNLNQTKTISDYLSFQSISINNTHICKVP